MVAVVLAISFGEIQIDYDYYAVIMSFVLARRQSDRSSRVILPSGILRKSYRIGGSALTGAKSVLAPEISIGRAASLDGQTGSGFRTHLQSGDIFQ